MDRLHRLRRPLSGPPDHQALPHEPRWRRRKIHLREARSRRPVSRMGPRQFRPLLYVQRPGRYQARLLLNGRRLQASRGACRRGHLRLWRRFFLRLSLGNPCLHLWPQRSAGRYRHLQYGRDQSPYFAQPGPPPANKPGHVEEIWYESSKDHRKIQGWIVHPPDFDPAKKYPLILEIHGGPFGDYGDRFDFEKQVWASLGYVVLYTNPRGSTGYGEEFANLIHHAYPGDDFYDLNSGVDAVIAKGYIDPSHLYVTGGSGGGVLTCWTIEHTDRFRAAASL